MSYFCCSYNIDQQLIYIFDSFQKIIKSLLLYVIKINFVLNVQLSYTLFIITVKFNLIFNNFICCHMSRKPVDVHNYLLDHYRKSKMQKTKRIIQKQSIVRQAYQKKIIETTSTNFYEEFTRNQQHIAADSEPLSFRSLPRKLKCYFPKPPTPPPKLQQVPYTYEIVPNVPYKLPKQKKGYVGDWVLQQSYFVDKLNQTLPQYKTKQKVQLKDVSDRNRRFRSQIKRIVRKMKDQNLSLKQIIKNKGFIKKPYNYYNSYEFFQYIKQANSCVQSMLQANPYLAYDIDDQKMTALHWAAREGHVYIVKILLQKYRANASAKDVYGRTPLHLAVANKHHECAIRIFIEGGQISALNNDKKSVRQVASDSYTKYLLQKLQESRFLVKTMNTKSPQQYKNKLESTIRQNLDESSLYF